MIEKMDISERNSVLALSICTKLDEVIGEINQLDLDFKNMAVLTEQFYTLSGINAGNIAGVSERLQELNVKAEKKEISKVWIDGNNICFADQFGELFTIKAETGASKTKEVDQVSISKADYDVLTKYKLVHTGIESTCKGCVFLVNCNSEERKVKYE